MVVVGEFLSLNQIIEDAVLEKGKIRQLSGRKRYDSMSSIGRGISTDMGKMCLFFQSFNPQSALETRD